MCGIAGFFGNIGEEKYSHSVLNKMLSRIRHRGPDESGVFLSPLMSMGSVRLSIIDLASGQQPLCDDTGRYWIAFNGEIFNYRELRIELEKLGCNFRTNSDTEVLLFAFREYGTDCLNKLNGQFAFAVWDTLEKRLFLARDRVGIRPLFYTFSGEHLVFGSEIKALFEFPGLHRKLDEFSLQQVFTFWTSLSPRTAFEKVNELPPAHFMIFENGHVKLKRYWTPVFSSTENSFKGTMNEAGEELESLLNDSVALRLRADVPVGAYLSGGLDSSVIALLIRNQVPEGLLETFSIGFSDAEYDEGSYQDKMVELLKTRHHRAYCSQDDIVNGFPEAVWHAEMPLLRTAPLPMKQLSGLVRQNNIKVVMTGEGADEMLGGYNIFKEMEIRRFWARNPDSVIRPLLLGRLYPYLPQLRKMGPNALKMFFGYRLQDTDSVLYSHLLRWNNTSKIRKMMRNNSSGNQQMIGHLEQILTPVLERQSDLGKAQFIESEIFMSGYLLSSQGDRMAMSNSVEGRYPFLDHRVMEFCHSLPDDFKLRGLKEKVLLKHQFKNRLPDDVVNRAKQAYRAPLATPFLRSGTSGYVSELLSADICKAAGIFDEKAVEMLLTRLRKSNNYSEVDQMAFVAVLSTHLLWKQFVDEFKPLSPEEIREAEVRGVIKV
ncbi:asparagine synthase (glutamine-hydrolyzing) [Marinilabilia salmonicolor]|jgi:asparagine synthase (glutamine-hydrolysing)|uniref:asparagine synthase (glutamine-hydrolyzing) n=1 Tax=Marinilabilia salmonicolor TaxID=989 RepID=A0A2T0XEK0_9BACT|nr:asparagine synthase (glutamine-hydrolyzing) [Marinilabilia salmonicolor]PRY97363.1 asparagine synthase (glutamine-hydrolysing) [Marinilabilia salmonicolor]RCW36736.1 asparagine synthase (glutamine-hydrolysing) [Marinilabilia salmonicolor]